MNGIYGVDVSGLIATSQWTSLKNEKQAQFAIVRCYHSDGKVDANAPQSIKNAGNAGLSWVDVYHFPHRAIDAATQVNDSVNALKQAGAPFVR